MHQFSLDFISQILCWICFHLSISNPAHFLDMKKLLIYKVQTRDLSNIGPGSFEMRAFEYCLHICLLICNYFLFFSLCLSFNLKAAAKDKFTSFWNNLRAKFCVTKKNNSIHWLNHALKSPHFGHHFFYLLYWTYGRATHS